MQIILTKGKKLLPIRHNEYYITGTEVLESMLKEMDNLHQEKFVIKIIMGKTTETFKLT